MKYNPEESYEVWVQKVEAHEKSLAMKRLANGDPPEEVLEDMGRRLMEKMLHPIFKSLIPPKPTAEEIAESRKRYEETMKMIGPRPDHIVDENIDKIE